MEADEIHRKNLDFNLGQTKVFVERLSVKLVYHVYYELKSLTVIHRVKEIDNILKFSDDAKKRSDLHNILKNLKAEIDVSIAQLQYASNHTSNA